MGRNLRHGCGFVVAHTLHDAYSFMASLQNRGREGAGMLAASPNRIDIVKWVGGVRRFDVDDLHDIFPGHDYNVFFGHVRYATRGRKDKILQDAHPHSVGGTLIDRGDHVFILDADAAIVHNGQIDERHFEDLDLEGVIGGCDSEGLLRFYMKKGIHAVLNEISGAYTLAIADKRLRGVMVVRDRTGIKPGILGWKDGKFGAASEDKAFIVNGGEYTEDLEPGRIYFLSHDGDYRKEEVVRPNVKHCMFEWQYLANRTSIMDGLGVRVHRALLGEQLAQEFNPDDAEIVTYVPRCPGIAAASYARATGKKFMKVLYKMRGERSFQGSTSDEREGSIRNNLHLSPKVGDSLRDKVIVVIEDSIVRGNVLKRTRELLYDVAGVRKAYLVSYTPPIGIIGSDGIERGCEFGVDMAPGDNFFALDKLRMVNRTIEEMSEVARMPVRYLSTEGMLRAFEKGNMPREKLCYYCVGGERPFVDLTVSGKGLE